MKLAIAQMNCLLGDLTGNSQQILDYAQQAKQQGARLLLTPELSLCGYPPDDLLLREGFYLASEQALLQLAAQIAGITVLVGHVQRKNGCYYNAASVLQDGQVIATYYKQHLPNYAVFDEKRYFAEGDSACVFELDGVSFGVNICADIWEAQPAALAKAAGAQVLLVINASPFAQDKLLLRYQTVAQRIRELSIPVVYANLVGGQDELVFDGGAFVMNAEAELVATAPVFEATLEYIELNTPAQCSGRMMPEMGVLQQTYRALCLAVHDYVTKNGFPGVLLGLSGGIDSAVTLAIAVDALGADKVHAVMMPSPYTAQISIDDSRDMIQRLGVRYDEFDIEPLFQQYRQVLAPAFAGKAEDLTEENLQARIRGMLLMALSNKFGSVVLTTGNKSEMSVGYATLYGDMAGGFAVLKDVAKTLVYRLASYRNTVGEVIPERIITRPPSAELRHDQTDQDSLPSYEVLDAIVAGYVEQDRSVADLIAQGYAEQDVRKVIRLIRLSEYKRQQSAIGPRITARSYGKDWRYQVTARYSDIF